MSPDKINHIFFPHTEEKTNHVKKDNLRFAYYTTAATAYSIIENTELWMRNTSTMNDYREVEHGLDCLRSAIDSPEGVALRSAIDSIFPGLTEKAIKHFNGWLPHIRQDTYIACVSEHSATEDPNGRLSMWRAYGGNSGVALVFRPDALFRPGDVGIYASPVAYWSEAEVKCQIALISERVRAHTELVRTATPELISNILFIMLRFAVLCTKHPGFKEEHEWRLITCPTLEKSPILRQTVDIVRGTPQLIQRIRLQDVPDAGIYDLKLSNLLDRIIIGPCEYPDAVYKAMTLLLKKAGFEKPSDLIHISDIPLRVTIA